MIRRLAAAALLAAAAAPLAAQSPLPAAGPAPEVRAPAIERETLGNGLELWVVTRRDLPIVNARLVIRAGSAQDGAHAGLAQMTAALLDEGAGSRDALQFANAVQDLGSSLGAFAGTEELTVSLQSLSRTLASSLELMGDMVVRPRFAPEEVERERARRLQDLRRQSDQPTVVATRRFNELVYGADHPYGRPPEGTLESVGAITRDDVAAFHAAWVRPNNAILVVVGDVTRAQLKVLLARAFRGWERQAVPAALAAVPPRPAARPTAVYLVDKPGAAQSEIRIGHAGAARTAPDRDAVQVLNTALGGQFSSRINMNLRETRGFTYGARSSFSADRGDGPFVASAGVFTAKTDSAVAEFLRELRDVRGPRPLTAEEVTFASGSLVRAYPRRLESGGAVAALLADLAFHRLPAREITDYLTRLGRVTPAEVTAAARQRLQPDSLVVVVVGDLATIRPGIEALGLGPVTVLE